MFKQSFFIFKNLDRKRGRLTKSLRGRKPPQSDFGTVTTTSNYVPVNTSALNLIAGTSTRLPDTLTLCFQKALFCPGEDIPKERKKSSPSIWNPFRNSTKNIVEAKSKRRHHSLTRTKLSMNQPTTNGNLPESFSNLSTSGSTDFEFRPCGKDANDSSNPNMSSNNRSKSPSAIIGRFTNFARGKYRSSLNEKSMLSTQDDKQRRV